MSFLSGYPSHTVKSVISSLQLHWQAVEWICLKGDNYKWVYKREVTHIELICWCSKLLFTLLNRIWCYETIWLEKNQESTEWWHKSDGVLLYARRVLAGDCCTYIVFPLDCQLEKDVLRSAVMAQYHGKESPVVNMPEPQSSSCGSVSNCPVVMVMAGSFSTLL